MSIPTPRAPDREVLLRDVTESDLTIFFEQQREPEANRMAAFAARDQREFMAHWMNNLADVGIRKKCIVVDGQVAGNIVSFERLGVREVGYWIGEAYWGRGVATMALQAFLREEPLRPLYAGVAKDNLGSIRVLKKCGFIISGEEAEFSEQRGQEVTFVILRLGTDQQGGDQ